MLSVICESGSEEKIREIIFTESTTLGLRTFDFKKDTLTREFSKLNTRYGEVTVKRSFYNGKEVSAKPEYDECKRIAQERDVPLKEVCNNIISLLTRKE